MDDINSMTLLLLLLLLQLLKNGCYLYLSIIYLVKSY